MEGLNQSSRVLFSVIVIVWVYSLGWVAIKGIQYVGQVAKVLNWVPLVMMLIVFWANREGVSRYRPPHVDSAAGFFNVLTIVIGFFATAGAAGADFGMNNRNRKDIALGGICGIVGGALVAGGLAILSVAGNLGLHATGTVDFSYTAAIVNAGALAPVMFFLFAAASMVPTCFSSFIAANSFSTMIPKIPRPVSALAAVTVSAILAITGIASHLVDFFGIVGASFSPICGAMAADYIRSGMKWPGPRAGINWAGFIALAAGFAVGMPTHIPGLPEAWVKADNPAVLYSFGVGFLVYYALAQLGFEPAAMRQRLAHNGRDAADAIRA
jgi:cytosine permease